MTWLTWRQHRLAALSTLVVAVGLTAALLIVDPTPRPHWSNQLVGIQGPLWYALLVVPLLAGLFFGVPLFARELEFGTHRLALTQCVTRGRYVAARLALVGVPLVVTAGLVGAAAVRGLAGLDWGNRFDQEGLAFAAYSAFALALGIAFGAFLGRALPAMVATLISYVAVRAVIEIALRPHYQPPLAVSWPSNETAPPAAVVSAWWVLATGPPPSTIYYQPIERFWTFQVIEAAIFLALTALLLTITILWMRRRIS